MLHMAERRGREALVRRALPHAQQSHVLWNRAELAYGSRNVGALQDAPQKTAKEKKVCFPKWLGGTTVIPSCIMWRQRRRRFRLGKRVLPLNR